MTHNQPGPAECEERLKGLLSVSSQLRAHAQIHRQGTCAADTKHCLRSVWIRPEAELGGENSGRLLLGGLLALFAVASQTRKPAIRSRAVSA